MFSFFSPGNFCQVTRKRLQFLFDAGLHSFFIRKHKLSFARFLAVVLQCRALFLLEKISFHLLKSFFISSFSYSQLFFGLVRVFVVNSLEIAKVQFFKTGLVVKFDGVL